MPRLQAAAAGALITFCNPTRMQAEWLYAPAPTGMGDVAIGMALLEALSTLLRTSTSVVVREEALSAVGCVAQVRAAREARGQFGRGRRFGFVEVLGEWVGYGMVRRGTARKGMVRWGKAFFGRVW